MLREAAEVVCVPHGTVEPILHAGNGDAISMDSGNTAAIVERP